MRHDILSVASQDLTDGVIYYEDRSPGLGLDFLDNTSPPSPGYSERRRVGGRLVHGTADVVSGAFRLR